MWERLNPFFTALTSWLTAVDGGLRAPKKTSLITSWQLAESPFLSSLLITQDRHLVMQRRLPGFRASPSDLKPGKWLFSPTVLSGGFQVHDMVKHRNSDYFLGTDYLCSVAHLTVVILLWALCKALLELEKRPGPSPESPFFNRWRHWCLKRYTDAPTPCAIRWQSWASNSVHWLVSQCLFCCRLSLQQNGQIEVT